MVAGSIRSEPTILISAMRPSPATTGAATGLAKKLGCCCWARAGPAMQTARNAQMEKSGRERPTATPEKRPREAPVALGQQLGEVLHNAVVAQVIPQGKNHHS